MTALEWRYKRRDESGKIVQEDWRQRPEGVTIHALHNEAVAEQGGSEAAVHQVESRPVPVAST
jgi:hypothetical protein